MKQRRDRVPWIGFRVLLAAALVTLGVPVIAAPSGQPVPVIEGGEFAYFRLDSSDLGELFPDRDSGSQTYYLRSSSRLVTEDFLSSTGANDPDEQCSSNHSQGWEQSCSTGNAPVKGDVNCSTNGDHAHCSSQGGTSGGSMFNRKRCSSIGSGQNPVDAGQCSVFGSTGNACSAEHRNNFCSATSPDFDSSAPGSGVCSVFQAGSADPNDNFCSSFKDVSGGGGMDSVPATCSTTGGNSVCSVLEGLENASCTSIEYIPDPSASSTDPICSILDGAQFSLCSTIPNGGGGGGLSLDEGGLCHGVEPPESPVVHEPHVRDLPSRSLRRASDVTVPGTRWVFQR